MQHFDVSPEARALLPMPAKLILFVHENHDENIEEVVSVCLNRMAGWQVIAVSWQQNQPSSLLTQQPDAVLFNAIWFGVNGLNSAQKRILQWLKSYPLTQSSPILLLIDTASWFTLDQLQSLGIAGALAKPFDPETLPAQIAQMLRWYED